ncbi:MAG: hypothetical protein EOM87_05095 [Clostridia bacterium]|nr:hypothetical protein [Clostridia bacterium]
MKKLRIFMLITLALIMSLSLYACDNEPVVLASVAETIAIPQATYANVAELLLDLDEQSIIQLEYTEYGDFGMSITSIKGTEKELISVPVSSIYISVYLSSDDINYIDLTMPTVVYDNRTYYGAALGVSSLPVISGVAYLFCLVIFNADWTSTINQDALIILE